MIELDEDELEEYADLWGVSVNQVEDLFAQLDPDSTPELIEDVDAYIQDWYDALTEAGEDIDISDLYDIFYGYGPGGEGES